MNCPRFFKFAIAVCFMLALLLAGPVDTACAQSNNSSIVVANTDHNSIDFFSPTASGDVAPIRTIMGANTNFNRPVAVEMYNNELYVLNHEAHAIEVFNSTDSGNVAPKRRIVGTSTGMGYPSGFTFDNGEIYVTNYSGNITVYDADDSGNVSPKRTISQGNAMSITVAGDELFVTTYTNAAVYVYNKSNGEFVRTITGANTGFSSSLYGLAVSDEQLFVSDYTNKAIKVFPIAAAGDVAPSRSITGDQTQLNLNRELCVCDGELLVMTQNSTSSAVLVYNATNEGNVAPKQVISGASTTFSGSPGPGDVTVVPNPDSWANYAAGDYAGGDGSSENPYQIATAEQLALLAQNAASGNDYYSGSYFELTADIDLAGHYWVPITMFKGHLNGCFHRITRLTINNTNDYNGLIGQIEGAEVNNLGIINCSIIGNTNNGALAGSLKNSSVNGCYSSGVVKAYGDNGGLIGCIAGGENHLYRCGSSCTVTATVTSPTDAARSGGLIGPVWSSTTTLDDCYATGTVTGTENIGGLVGIAYNSGSLSLTNCYSTGNVTNVRGGGWFNTGGILGCAAFTTTITNCYAAGTVTLQNPDGKAGGIVGGRDSGASITTTNSYYNENNPSGEGGGTPTSLDNMKTPDFVYALNASQDPVKWLSDFTPAINGGYPVLSSQLPGVTSAITNTAGDKIILTFNRPMADPTGQHNQFVINSVNGSVAAAALSFGDNTKIELTPATTIAPAQMVLVSYTAGDVRDLDSVPLATFTNQPVIDMVPSSNPVYLLEGFETTGGSLPSGWSVTALAGWRIGTPTLPTTTAHGGSNVATFESHNLGENSICMLRSPGIRMPVDKDHTLKFWMYHNTDYIYQNDRVEVKASPDGGFTWNLLATYTRLSQINGWQEHTLSLDAYSGLEDLRIGFHGISAYGDNIHIDDVSIGEPDVDLIAPTPGGGGNLSSDLVTENSFRLNWSAATDNWTTQNSLQYKVIYSTYPDISTIEADQHGITAADWTAGLVSYTLTGLAPYTTYYYNVLVKDETGNTAAYTMGSVKTLASTNAHLSSLVTSVGSLTPNFSPDTESYTASVNQATSTITVTPTVEEEHATITVNGQAVTSGQASEPIRLYGGANTINIVVTAQNQSITKSYAITVNRETIDTPDLTFSVPLAVTPNVTYSGGKIKLTYTIINNGPLQSGACNVKFYLLEHPTDAITADKCIGLKAVSKLKVSKTKKGTVNVKFPDTQWTTGTVVAVIDADGTVNEMDKWNNTSSANISISYPDLTFVPESLVVPSSAAQGAKITIQDSVINNGGAPAGKTNVTYYLWNGQDQSSKRLLGQRKVSALKPGKISKGKVKVTLPAMDSGYWYVMAVIDEGNSVFELFGETNNTVSGEIRIGNPI